MIGVLDMLLRRFSSFKLNLVLILADKFIIMNGDMYHINITTVNSLVVIV